MFVPHFGGQPVRLHVVQKEGMFYGLCTPFNLVVSGKTVKDVQRSMAFMVVVWIAKYQKNRTCPLVVETSPEILDAYARRRPKVFELTIEIAQSRPQAIEMLGDSSRTPSPDLDPLGEIVRRVSAWHQVSKQRGQLGQGA